MALIDDVKDVCDRLAPKGWDTLFRRHGLIIGAPNLDVELTRDLAGIDRDVAGFEDFTPEGRMAVEGGSPARSLLYHALASPAVHPTANGSPSNDPDAYPTMKELDTVEIW